MKEQENNDMEQHIITVAKKVFIRDGYECASMSDIALEAGINRPTLHYYFRTKDRLFETVSAQILSKFIPAIHEIVMQDIPLYDRISLVVDTYYEVVLNEPMLPIYAIKEIHRDAEHFIQTALNLDMGKYIMQIAHYIKSEMDKGHLNQIEPQLLFYTFWGLMYAPFITKPLTNILFKKNEEDNNAKILLWKQYVIDQLFTLLSPR